MATRNMETTEVTRKRFNAKKQETAKAATNGVQHETATVEDAAKLFRVCHATIRRRLKEGSLPGTRVGVGPWRLPWAKIREIAGVN